MKKFNSFRNRQNGFEDLGSDTAEAAKTKKSWWKIPGIILVILVIAIFAFNSTYQIREQEQAVLITLGQAKAVTDPGLHFKIPFIQQVRKVNTTIQGFSLGYDVDSNSSETDDSLMITSDYNFVNVDFFVEYRFSDPVKAVYASKDPVLILRNISQSCIRTVIGSYPVDDVLTTGKNEIQAAIKDSGASERTGYRYSAGEHHDPGFRAAYLRSHGSFQGCGNRQAGERNRSEQCQ